MLSRKVVQNLTNSSWIRAMFEEGEKLRATYGSENVFDYSLGNPDYAPPELVQKSIQKHLLNKDIHKYMNNAGYDDVRGIIAESISKQTEKKLTKNNIVMTCGAAGGINVVLKTILNPDDEVIIFSPFFAEYIFYVDNHQGKVVISPTDKNTFLPIVDEFERSITKNCKAIIINSPNNPTGVIYPEELLIKLAEVIANKEKEFNTSIYVISDEPYIKLIYDKDVVLPNMINIFENTIVVNSFSKSHALAGERIGYIAVSPSNSDFDMLMNGLIFSNRVLGYVNAPSLFQKVIAETIDISIDTSEYKRRRDFLYENLTSLGYECTKPQGAFYFFPKSLIDDDVEFAKSAIKYNLLIVPGKGFGRSGYFRIAYCSDFEKIKNSIRAFEKLAKEYK